VRLDWGLCRHNPPRPLGQGQRPREE
jgi:hypothetical protein